MICEFGASISRMKSAIDACRTAKGQSLGSPVCLKRVGFGPDPSDNQGSLSPRNRTFLEYLPAINCSLLQPDFVQI